jgi:hypothetical protein
MSWQPERDHALLHVSSGPQLSHWRFALVVHGDTSFAPLQSAHASQRASSVDVPATKYWRPGLHVRMECGRQVCPSVKKPEGHASGHERASLNLPCAEKTLPVKARTHG